jgi:hypothetical protein
MNNIIFVLFLYGCSQVSVKKQPPTPVEELVSIEATLNHIFASYLKGCADTSVELKVPVFFENCRDKAKLHKQEVKALLDQTPL